MTSDTSGTAPDASAESLPRLVWLADAVRNQGIAVRDPPRPFAGLDWTEGLTYHESQTEYATRSIAVSPDGQCVAVGTKSGSIQLLLRSSDGIWESRALHGSREGEDPGAVMEASQARFYAIRGLGFVADRALVAGFGHGYFRLFDVAGRGVFTAKPSPGASFPYVDRCRRVVPLVRNFSFSENEDWPIALALTAGKRTFFFHHRNQPDQGDDLPHNFSEAAPLSSYFEGWEDSVRLVGGVWARDQLWLLGHDGQLRSYRPPVAARARFTLVWSGKIKGPHAVAVPVFSDLWGGDDGLAIHASGHLTLVLPRYLVSGVPAPAPTWLACAGVSEVAVLQPCCADPHPVRPHPVWMYVATRTPGLLWISWELQSAGEGTPIVGRRSFRSFAAVGHHQVVHVAAAKLDRAGCAAPASYLAFTTRNERLGLVSFIELVQTTQLLARELPSALAGCDTSQLTPGVALWLARRRLYRDFGEDLRGTLRPRGVGKAWIGEMPPIHPCEEHLVAVPGPKDSPPPWLALLEAEDLRELARDLALVVVSGANRMAEGSRENDAFVARFKLWVMLLLQRATQMDPSQGPGLSPSLALELLSGVERVQSNAPLRAFGEAIRKWIVHGDSFNAITRGLAEHADWNLRSRRLIDAVVFATRLLDQRVDLQATSQLPVPHPNPAIWDLVVSERGDFSIQSHTDGRISACSADGSPCKWSLPDDAKLAADSDHYAIHRRDADDFRRELWYGPLARALALMPLGGSRHLLVFGTRGWPNRARRQRSPEIHALIIEEQAQRLQVLSIAHAETQEDVFSLVALALPEPASESGQLRLIAGTAWGGASFPFLELWVSYELRGRTARLSLSAHQVWDETQQGTSDLMRNPVGALAYSSHTGLLFTGQHDGRIRAFRKRDGRWQQVRGLGLPRAPAAVRVLACRTDGERDLLAFGATDATCGMVVLETAADASSAGHPDEQPAPPLPWLFHTRESSAICGLCFYEDKPKHGSDLCSRLMAVTQDGMVCIWDADMSREKPIQREGSIAPPVASPPGYENRRSLAGTRLDHFGLGVVCRAMAVQAGHSVPSFVVGGADGQVRSYALSVPKGTWRRGEQAAKSLSSHLEFHAKVEPVTREGIGEEYLLRWLRIAPIGSQHLVRYAIWVELRNRAGAIDAAISAGSSAQFATALDEYSEAVLVLSDELFRRRPFSKEPIKIVWEEGSKVLNAIGTHAIAHVERSRREAFLAAFIRLGTQLSGLCNQWLGYDQALESTILIHSFNTLMDWPSIVFVSGLSDVENAAVRRFVLEELIRPRLFSDDPLVTLEALRAINLALERAIDRASRAAGLIPPMTDLRFFELVDLVGSFAKKHEAQLGLHEPLCTEVARFFVLTLAWLPDGTIALAARVSDFGLAEPPRRLDRSILVQGGLLCTQMRREFGFGKLCALEEKLSRYDAYLKQRDRRYEDTGMRDPRVDSRVGRQLSQVLKAAKLLEEVSDQEDEVQRCLEFVPYTAGTAAGGDHEQDCFAQSRAILSELVELRTRLHGTLTAVRSTFKKEDPYRAALELCERAEARIKEPDAVFEPQRSRYLAIVSNWRGVIQQEQVKLYELFRIIDRFNRHIYQAAADDLVASLQELAFRASPMSFSEEADEEPGSLRWLMLQRLGNQPVLKDVFQRGTRLVEYAHLSGTLLAVAKDLTLGGRSEQHAAEHTVTVEVIKSILKDLHSSYGIAEFNCDIPERFLRCRVPGSGEIWDTILREWTRNVVKYGLGLQRTSSARLQAEPSAQLLTLSMYGDKPFRQSLSDEYSHMSDDELRELIAGIRHNERNSFSRGSEHAGGFGLHLLLRLCEWMDLRAELAFEAGGPLVFKVAWPEAQS